MSEPTSGEPAPTPSTSSGMTAGKLALMALSGLVLAAVGCGTFVMFLGPETGYPAWSPYGLVRGAGAILFVAGGAAFVLGIFGALLMGLGSLFQKKTKP